MRPGFWPSNFWPDKFWAEDYWPDFAEPSLPRYTPVVRELPLSEYLAVGKFRVESWRRGPELQLVLKDWKTRLEVNAPSGTFQRGDLNESLFTYPNIHKDIEGKPVPLAFGRVFDLPCFLIDEKAKRFKVLANASIRFDEVRANGNTILPDSIDLAKSEFVWSAWEDEDLAVDLTAAGSNPADCVELLLTTYGGEAQADLLTPTGTGDPYYRKGFGAYGSRLSWISGATRDGVEHHMPEVGLYVGASKPVLELIESVCTLALARLYYDPEGFYYLDRWMPLRLDEATPYAAPDVSSLDVEESNPSVLTRIVAKFAERVAAGSTEAVTAFSEERKNLRNLPAHVSKEFTLPTPDRRAARWWASSILAQQGQPLTTYKAVVNQKGWTARPGQNLRIVYPKRNVDAVMEVLAVEATPGRGKVTLTLGDNRGMRDRAGFWREDAAPDWNAAGSAEEKREARGNSGFWQDDNNFCGTPDDKASFKASVWI